MPSQPQSGTEALRAMTAYRFALEIRESGARMATEYPKAAAKLEEAARLLIAEGKTAEAKASA